MMILTIDIVTFTLIIFTTNIENHFWCIQILKSDFLHRFVINVMINTKKLVNLDHKICETLKVW